MDTMSLAEAATLERFNASQDRVARDFGYGSTAGGLGVSRVYIEELSAAFQLKLSDISNLREQDLTKDLLRVISKLDPNVIALSVLDGVLHGVATEEDHRGTLLHVAANVQGECWAADLLEADAKLASRITRAVRRRHGSLKYRTQAARSIAARTGFRGTWWSRPNRVRAGGWLVNVALEALPDVFVVVDEGDNRRITITEGALALAEQAVEQTLCRSAMFLPCTEPPKPWTDWNNGGYWDERTRLRASIFRTHHKETTALVRGAMKDGTLAPHLNAVNALQAVPYKINERVLEVLQWAYDNGIAVEGLPPKEDVAEPPKPAAWENMDETATRLWKYRAGQVRVRNRSLVSNRVLFAQDVCTARRLLSAGRFWTPLNCDWRGRVYAVPHFNFQRDDRVRALFLFADGEPIGTEGLYWLKVHVANCGDFDKISKRPLKERVQWVDQNLDVLLTNAESPLLSTSLSFWTKADKPFLFLAACMEMRAAITQGSAFITHLPVSWDGSCSGLQHLAAMTRDEETAKLVNLLPGALPQDVYQTVADSVNARLTAEAVATTDAPAHGLAKHCLSYGITRTIVKRNVMTYSYSSKKYGMSQQLVEDLMRPLAFEVLSGKLEEHPFGPDDGRVAAKYLAGHVYDAIETIVHKPAQAMAMLQKCARALAHEGKPLSWVTPTGLPWINRYHAPNIKRIELWLHDTRIQMKVADGSQKEIDKDKAANGVAPNFVHALDASHLALTANAAVAEGITSLATVHDSFGCLASRAGRFNQIIREQFVAMYSQHDVLQEVLEQAKHDLTVHNWQRLPAAPQYGSLDLTGVLNADFAFA